jgi:hypothetical protein
MLLFTEHIVFWFSLWVSFTWGILYLFLNTVSQVFRQSHNFNTWQVGLVFVGMIVGAILSFGTAPIQDRFYSRASRRNNGNPRPEARLYVSCVGSLIFTSGLFWFGWSSGPNVPWIVPVLALGWTTIGIYTVYVFAFLRGMTDVRRRYSIIWPILTRFTLRRRWPPRVSCEMYLVRDSRFSAFKWITGLGLIGAWAYLVRRPSSLFWCRLHWACIVCHSLRVNVLRSPNKVDLCFNRWADMDRDRSRFSKKVLASRRTA